MNDDVKSAPASEKEAREWLHSLYMLGMKMDLDNVTALCEALGNPQNAYPCVHVAGTNGKGSVCQMVASVLGAFGLRVGVYTSPHLVDMRERIVVGGMAVNDHDLLELTRRMHPLVRETALSTGGHPTYFEVTTAMAFSYFRAAGVDVAVLETGLGGRLDSTNIVTPVISCITSIGADHTDVLGTDLAVIAREKAGIIKDGVPVVIGVPEGAAQDVIVSVARERRAPLTVVNPAAVSVARGPSGDGRGCVISFRDGWCDCRDVPLGLAGAHQLSNAATALTLLRELDPSSVGIGAFAYRGGLSGRAREGFARLKWPARLQRVPGHPLLILDGAHNPDGLAAVSGALKALFPERRFRVIFGAMADKDVGGMVRPLRDVARGFTTVPVDVKRAVPPGELARLIREAPGDGMGLDVDVSMDLGETIEAVMSDREGAYLVTGSIYLAGEFMERYMAAGHATADELGLPPPCDVSCI